MAAENLRKGWLMVLTASAFYAFQFVVRVFPNVMHDDILHALGADAQTLGWVLSLYGTAYAMMQLPLGMLLDRIGPRLLLGFSCLLCASATILFASTKSPNVAALARFLMGLGSASGFLSCIKIATLWLPSHLLARGIAVSMIFGTIGASLGGSPICHLKAHIGYEATLLVIGSIGIALSLLQFRFIRNFHSAEERTSREKSPSYSHASPWEDLITVIRNPQSWYIALFSMIMYAPITILGEAWGIPYIHHLSHVSNARAAEVITIMFIGAAVGSPVFTLFSDGLKSRVLPMIVGGILSFALSLWLIRADSASLTLMKLVFFMIGFSYTAKVLTFSAICEIMPKNISGVSIAFVNTIVMSTGAFFHPLVGKLVQAMSDSRADASISTYTISDYQHGLLVLPISLAIGLFVVTRIRETHPLRAQATSVKSV